MLSGSPPSVELCAQALPAYITCCHPRESSLSFLRLDCAFRLVVMHLDLSAASGGHNQLGCGNQYVFHPRVHLSSPRSRSSCLARPSISCPITIRPFLCLQAACALRSGMAAPVLELRDLSLYSWAPLLARRYVLVPLPADWNFPRFDSMFFLFPE